VEPPIAPPAAEQQESPAETGPADEAGPSDVVPAPDDTEAPSPEAAGAGEPGPSDEAPGEERTAENAAGPGDADEDGAGSAGAGEPGPSDEAPGEERAAENPAGPADADENESGPADADEDGAGSEGPSDAAADGPAREDAPAGEESQTAADRSAPGRSSVDVTPDTQIGLLDYLVGLASDLPQQKRETFEHSDIPLRIERLKSRLQGRRGLNEELGRFRDASRRKGSSELTPTSVAKTLEFLRGLSDYHPNTSVGNALSERVGRILNRMHGQTNEN
jgi:hypothetical protein